MAKTRVERTVAIDAVKKIIWKAINTKGKQFAIGKYSIIPRIVVAEGDLFLDFSRTLLDRRAFSRIESVVVDVIGLRKKKATRIEIFKDGTIVYSPKIGRDENEVKKLVEMLAKNAKVN